MVFLADCDIINLLIIIENKSILQKHIVYQNLLRL